MKIAIPLFGAGVSPRFDHSKTFLLVEAENGSLIERQELLTEGDIEDFYYNEFLGEKKHIGVKVVRIIIGYKIDLLYTSNIGEISFHMLKNNLVDIYKAEEGLSVQEIIESHRLNKLQPLTVPTHSVEESQVAK